MHTHWDQCRAHVLQYADALVESVKAGKVNASACEGLIDSYLQQSAYSNVNRPKLLALALERLGHCADDKRPNPNWRFSKDYITRGPEDSRPRYDPDDRK